MTDISIGRFSHDTLINLAREYGTPLYVYDGDSMSNRFHHLKTAFEKHYDKVRVFYALKANTNMSIVSLLRQAGAGGECISMGELMLARRLGFAGENLIFTSNSKSPEELAYAVQENAMINLDSLGDLTNLMDVCQNLQKKVRVSFRLNTDVDPNTHRHIATSHKTTKFGIMTEEIVAAYRQAHDCPWLDVWGMHSHIGSQILDASSFIKNIEIMLHACRRIKDELGLELKFLNAGGGLGLPYGENQAPLPLDSVAEAVCNHLKQAASTLGYLPELWLEPGRFFTGDAGFLLARVNSVKYTAFKNFINVDTGFNHLLRPVLYEAYHRVRVLGRHEDVRTFDVAGNICETGDIMAENRQLPTPRPGDVVAFLDAGAYGFSMASEFNMFPLPAEVMVRGDRAELIRSRASMDDLLRNQILLKDLMQTEEVTS